jgi:hypothetical protein
MERKEEAPLNHLAELPPLSDAERNAFVAAQYNEVRKEVIDRLKELWALEKYAFLGAAGLAAWLLTNTTNLGSSARLAWWLPLVFLVACLARFIAGMRHLLSRTTPFLVPIEKRYLGDKGGWEQWFAQQPKNETYAFTVAWGVALCAAIALAIVKM